mmetsp:Transcript_9623/g.16882  ORF Transcript_9623/g.16882 Transcript_9623/m.16882 type:complete len:753 (-) Transcript_9623:1901-4159(-)
MATMAENQNSSHSNDCAAQTTNNETLQDGVHESPSTGATTAATVSSPKVVQRSKAWSLPNSTKDVDESTSGKEASKPLSFAEIMAEQTQDRLAAQVAYSAPTNMGDDEFVFPGNENSKTLVEMQAEQERLFSSLAKHQQSLAVASSSSPFPDEGGLDPEELRMIELAMQESLKDCAADNKNPSTTTDNKEGSGPAPTTLMSQTSGYSSKSSIESSVSSDPEFREQVRRETERTTGPVVDSPYSSPPAGSGTEQVQVVASDSAGPGSISSVEGISAEEAAAIEAALREADAKEEAESLRMALQIQQEEIRRVQENQRKQQQQQLRGNVRTMTRAELEAEKGIHVGSDMSTGVSNADQAWADDDEVDHVEDYGEELQTAGFRMNSATPQQWNRRDRNTIVGPNKEVRTKHDVRVQGQANAQLLALDTDDYVPHVGNQAFNSFRKKMKGTTKGVATHGTGRAGSDADQTRGKAMDSHVRLLITRAINNELIERCNGVVKQGKEAMIYHADKGRGPASDGFDVAVKVFKRIQEFRGRGDYVDGDPRYAGRPFNAQSERAQLEIWTEKEYRNLVRAHRAKVPVPTPLEYKQNVLFMRFMGSDGWPAPQIREISMRKGSKKWLVLYNQVMESIRRLYVDGRLVHGDLSEYNILIAPVFQVDHPINPDEESYELQTVLIDFGQSVDVRHPEASELLERDLTRVKQFFSKQGVETMGIDDAMQFVVGSCDEDKKSSEVCNLEKVDKIPAQNEVDPADKMK